MPLIDNFIWGLKLKVYFVALCTEPQKGHGEERKKKYEIEETLYISALNF